MMNDRGWTKVELRNSKFESSTSQTKKILIIHTNSCILLLLKKFSEKFLEYF